MKIGRNGRLAVLKAKKAVSEIVLDIGKLLESGGSMVGWFPEDQDDIATKNETETDGCEDVFQDFHDSM